MADRVREDPCPEVIVAFKGVYESIIEGLVEAIAELTNRNISKEEGEKVTSDSGT